MKAEDFEQLSSKEIDFRETVIKFESKLKLVLSNVVFREEEEEREEDAGEAAEEDEIGEWGRR